MSDYQELLGLAAGRLALAAGQVHSVSARKEILLEALHELGISVLYLMQALFLKDRMTFWNVLEGVKQECSVAHSFKELPENFFLQFSKIAGKHGIGLGEVGSLQEIFHFGERHEKGIDFQHSSEENQFALAALNFERFLSFFEQATQLHEKVARL